MEMSDFYQACCLLLTQLFNLILIIIYMRLVKHLHFVATKNCCSFCNFILCAH